MAYGAEYPEGGIWGGLNRGLMGGANLVMQMQGMKQKQEEVEMQKQLMQIKLDEATRQQEMGDTMSSMLQPKRQEYFNNQPMLDATSPDTSSPRTANDLTTFGQQKLTGLMSGVPQQLTQDVLVDANEGSAPYKDLQSQSVANPAYDPARQAALAQMQQMGGGEMVQPKMDMQQLIGALAKGSPLEAAKLQVSMQNTEAKAEMQKYVNEARYDYLKDILSAKTDAAKELAKERYNSALEIAKLKAGTAITINQSGIDAGKYNRAGKGGGRGTESERLYGDYKDWFNETTGNPEHASYNPNIPMFTRPQYQDYLANEKLKRSQTLKVSPGAPPSWQQPQVKSPVAGGTIRYDARGNRI